MQHMDAVVVLAYSGMEDVWVKPGIATHVQWGVAVSVM